MLKSFLHTFDKISDYLPHRIMLLGNATMGNTPKRSMTQRLAKKSVKVLGQELDCGGGSFSGVSLCKLSEEIPSKECCSSDILNYFWVSLDAQAIQWSTE